METFDSKKTSLYEILNSIHEGKIQLPDFQRGWVWDDNRIKGILASVAKSFPIGAVMLLETGNESIRFKTKPVEGAIDDEFDAILKSHLVNPSYMYNDNFYSFFNDRKERLLQKIETSMGKAVIRELPETEEGIFIDDNTDIEENDG